MQNTGIVSCRRDEDPAYIRDMLSASPDQLALLKQNNPRLAEAHQSGSLEQFAKVGSVRLVIDKERKRARCRCILVPVKVATQVDTDALTDVCSQVLREQQAARREREAQRLRMATADPFDVEAQRLIQQEISQKNIDHNMELAMEASPESFGSVIMLYINCTVNGHHIKAFVDSGAQATIMSQKAAERCNIMRLVDQRWAGVAKGVGTQKILGRVHMAQIQIESDFLTSSFSILEEQPMDMLLGLDMLKKHQCTIDLKKSVLVIGTTGTETPFLSEADLPPCARLSTQLSEDEVLKVSQQSAKAAEEKALAEAIARSASDTAMDTSSCSGAGEAGASGAASKQESKEPSPANTDTFKVGIASYV